MTDTEKRSAALAFLKNNRAGVLATISPQGTPHARLVYYSCDDAFNISFLTLSSTRKVADLMANNHAAFTVASVEVPRAIQMEGTVTDVSATGTVDAALSQLAENWLSGGSFGAPLTHLDLGGGINYYRFTPTWVRWEDYTAGNTTADVLSIIPVV